MTVVVWPNGLTTEPQRSDAYGPRRPIQTPSGWTRPFHVGRDWLLGGGKVHSIVAGVVDSVGPLGQLGVQVLVDCGVIDGHHYWIRYCHLVTGSTRVKQGQRVEAGTVLGIEGDTGASAGRHLHVEVYQDTLDRGAGSDPGDTVDPLLFILALFAAPAGGDEEPFIPAPPDEGDDEMEPYYVRTSAGGTVWMIHPLTGKRRAVTTAEWEGAKGRGASKVVRMVTREQLEAVPIG